MAGTKADTKSDDGPPAGGLRYLLRRREDPYAGADLDLARRMAAALYVIGADAVLVILPLAPPTKAIGGAGWAVGIAVVLCCFAGAARLRRAPARVSVN